MAQTMSPFKIEAYLTWQNESDARKEALKNAEQLPGETDSAFQMRLDAMPQPRTWLEFAIDPLEDGAPKDPSANAPGMLDPTDPLNADSLLLNPEWARMIPGQDFESLYFYKQSQKGRAGSLERISEEIFPSRQSTTTDVSSAPDQASTAAANFARAEVQDRISQMKQKLQQKIGTS